MRKDRLSFEKHRLSNGMTLYAYPADVPFALARIVIPFGHCHNSPELAGGAHFLEHSALHRSRRAPEKDSLVDSISLRGGSTNAYVTNLSTTHVFNAPTSLFNEKLGDWADLVFDPVFDGADLGIERGIVMNEKTRASKWFPTGDELETYLVTQWKSAVNSSIDRIYGTPESLEAMTPDALAALHDAYKDPRTAVFVGGAFDIDRVKAAFEGIPTARKEHQLSYEPSVWKRREYHERAFDDVTRFIYHREAIIDRPTYEDFIVSWFIGTLLTNPTQGPLFNWLRKEKGWVYDMGFSASRNRFDGTCGLWFPLNSKEEADVVRSELDRRMIAAISDRELVAREVERVKANESFWYQTVGEIIGETTDDLERGVEMHTETVMIELLEGCKDVGKLKAFYEKHLTTATAGEFLATPPEK